MTTQRILGRAAIGAVATAAAFSVLSAPPAAAAPMKKDGGALRVVAEGVPQGRSAKIVVAGKKFRKKVPAAGKLRNLRPGTYRVWPTPIVVDGGTAAVPNLPIRVRVPKRKATTLRLQYQWNPKSDVYPPGPATGLTVTGRTTSSIALRWVPSSAPDLAGVAVRRKLGSVPPAGLDDGRVVEVERGAQSLTDSGLAQYTTYSYSVFMVDSAGNASAPATVTVQTTGRASAVTAGLDHSCALLPGDQRDSVDPAATASGSVVCWGANDRGQLGDGGRAARDLPVAVPLEGVVEVRAGGAHTCARLSGGQVYCWGANDEGQLGDGTTADSSVPLRVDLPAASGLAAGGAHTCAVLRDGSLRCWGADDSGQAGQPIGDPVLEPRSVMTGVLGVAAGWAHTCAWQRTATKCFGENGEGQLGNGGTADTATPVTVPGLNRPVMEMAGGVTHTCAVTDSAALLCWGGNAQGQVGDGSTADRPGPVQVLSGVTAVAAGTYHTCAALENATMRCWGRNNSGRLGDGTEVDRSAPTRVVIASGVSALAAGGYHSCAVSGPDTYCWGANPFGQLGTGLPAGSGRPLPVAGL